MGDTFHEGGQPLNSLMIQSCPAEFREPRADGRNPFLMVLKKDHGDRLSADGHRLLIAVQRSESPGRSQHELHTLEFVEPFLDNIVEQRSFR